MDDKYAKQIRNILFIALTILLLAVFKVTASVSINLVLSVFISFFVMPLANSLEKHKVPSILATIISILLIIVIIVAACMFMVSAVNSLVSTLPSYAPRVRQIDGALVDTIRRWVELPEGFSIIGALNIDWIGSVIMPALKKISSQTVSILSDALVVLLFTIFLLLERHTIIPKIIMVSSKTTEPDRVSSIMDNINHQVSKYIAIKMIISAITGVCFYLIAVFTKLDFANLWGVLAFVLNFIPNIGSIIVTFLTIFMSVVQFLPNWTPVLIVAISTILVQNILGNIIEPRIQGSQLNLSPFVILASVSIFGYIWGIMGMFLSVPLLSVLEIIFANMESTKGVAIILSSGRSLRKKIRSERRNKQNSQFSDILF